MKKISILLTMAAFAANFNAQVISQSSDPVTITASNSPACGEAGLHTADNYYSRAFNLADYGIIYDYKITNIAFGVEYANKPFDVKVNLYNLVGSYPSGNTTPLATALVSVSSASALTSVNTGLKITEVVPAGSQIVLEIAHKGAGLNQIFRMGSNAAGETKPSYIKATACGINNHVTTASIGFGAANWVMTITGVNNLGVTEIINSPDVQVHPNPVKDFLSFKMANNLQVEYVELYDMTGRKVNTVKAKSIKNIDLSNFRKGTYILKVKASDGNVYVQKVLKD